MNREKLLTEEGEEVGGDGRAKGWSATGCGRQAESSLTPDADGTMAPVPVPCWRQRVFLLS